MKQYKLLGADGTTYWSDKPGTYGGNGKLKIYGRLDCPSALSTIRRFPGSYEKSRVFFADEKTALESIVQSLGKDRRTITRNIGVLREKQLLRRVGSDKTGHWEIIE